MMMNKTDMLKTIKTATTNKNMIVSLMKMIVIMLLMLKSVLQRLTKLLKETKKMHLLKTMTVHNNDNQEDEEGDTVFTASDLCLVSARFEPSQGHRLS
jgi:hypothetical protein